VPALGHAAALPVPHERRVVAVAHAAHVVGHREEVVQGRHRPASLQSLSFKNETQQNMREKNHIKNKRKKRGVGTAKFWVLRRTAAMWEFNGARCSQCAASNGRVNHHSSQDHLSKACGTLTMSCAAVCVCACSRWGRRGGGNHPHAWPDCGSCSTTCEKDAGRGGCLPPRVTDSPRQ